MSRSIKPNSQRVRKDESGVVLVIFAGTAFALLALLALAIDSGKAFRTRLIIQSSVDAAAMAGANVITEEGTGTNAVTKARTIAREVLESNLLVNTFPPASVNAAIAAGNFSADLGPGNGEPGTVDFSVLLRSVDLNTILFRYIPGMPAAVEVGSNSTVLIKPANVHILVDTSASMLCPPSGSGLSECDCGVQEGNNSICSEPASKLRLLKDAVKDFIDEFDPTRDRIGITAFNTGANIIVPVGNTPGFNPNTLKNAIENDLTPAGMTNPCDGLYKAFEDMRQNDLEENAAYVLFSDGAPTAGRFRWATANGGINAGSYYYLWESYTKCNIPLGSQTVEEAFIPARMVLADAGGPTAPSPVYNWAPGVNIPAPLAPCSDISCQATWSPEIAKSNRLRSCMNDVSFLTPGVPTAWNSAANKYVTGNSFNWLEHVVNSGRYRELFYDCSLAMADTIRGTGGSIFVVGVGKEAPTIDVPYQDITDNKRRKDIFLRRLAFDACAVNDPDFLGFADYSQMANLGFRQGLMLPSEPVDRNLLKRDLEKFFKIIASRIKWQLSR